MDVVLVHPEIPQNTGSVGRLTAGLGARLHLVEPLGFSLEDRYLRRAGLDYWSEVDLVVHRDVDTCLEALAGERPVAERLRLFSARGGQRVDGVRFAPDDVLVFGRESDGLPPDLLSRFADRRVVLPIRETIRSLNLSNAVAIGLWAAMSSAGVAFPGSGDGAYRPSGAPRSTPAERARRPDGSA